MRRCVVVLLMVCLMVGSAFATNSWTASTGSWGTASGWNRGYVPTDTEQVKIRSSTTCDLDVAAAVFTVNKVTVGANTTAQATLNIKSGGSLTSKVEIQVGDTGSLNGYVNQTGGTVTLSGIGTKDSKLELGYKGGVGAWSISGGSIVTGDPYSQLLVGASGSTNGGTGTFTVKGAGGSVTVSSLYVAVQDSVASYTGTGTLAFEINGGVSAINAGSVYIDPTGVAAAVANLSVTKTGALPTGNIILINNTGLNATQGAFDNIAWGSTILLGGINYTLSKTYDAASGINGSGNDVALIIPEPATVALLGLGLLALRRNKK